MLAKWNSKRAMSFLVAFTTSFYDFFAVYLNFVYQHILTLVFVSQCCPCELVGAKKLVNMVKVSEEKCAA